MLSELLRRLKTSSDMSDSMTGVTACVDRLNELSFEILSSAAGGTSLAFSSTATSDFLETAAADVAEPTALPVAPEATADVVDVSPPAAFASSIDPLPLSFIAAEEAAAACVASSADASLDDSCVAALDDLADAGTDGRGAALARLCAVDMTCETEVKFSINWSPDSLKPNEN